MTLSRHTGESPDSPFDRIRHEDQNGSEYWLATELLSLFGYKTWRRQKETTERAIISCANAGNKSSDHFVEVVQMAQIGDSQAYRQVVRDYKLSRLGCYLTAMNGDPRKPEIAAAQNYFTAKTREAEISQQQPQQLPPQPSPEERLSIVASVADKFGIDLSNPRIKQGIQDYFCQTLGITPQPLLSGEKWLSTAERAEELGFGRIGADLSKRVRLGQWVGKHSLERRREKRLVNGTNQSVWCYKVCGELDEVISSFFGGKQ